MVGGPIVRVVLGCWLMANQEDALAAEVRRKAGHYEILGETYAKFEFFENGWNSYSRFLDVDKVDLILRRKCFRQENLPRSPGEVR